MTITKRYYETITGSIANLAAGSIATTIITYPVGTTAQNILFEAICTAVASDNAGMTQVISGLVEGGAAASFPATGNTNPLSTLPMSKSLANGIPTFSATVNLQNLLIKVLPQDSGASLDAFVILRVLHLDSA